MSSRMNGIRLAASLLAVATTLALPGAADASAKVRKIDAAARHGKIVTFKVQGITSKRVRRAHVRVGSYERRLAIGRVRRAARFSRTRKLSVRLPKRVIKKNTPLRPVLVIALTPKPKPQIVVADPAPTPEPVQEAPASPEPVADPEPSAEQPAEQITHVPVTHTPSTDAPPASGSTEPAPPPAAAGDKATTRPVGSPILSDAEAASRVRRSGWEPRPENAAANQRVPQPGELTVFLRDNIAIHTAHKPLVTGNFTGTTDEIIQWAAWKWGVDEDLLRAVAVTESSWRSSAVGDNGTSFGMTQIKITYHAGTQPLSSTSTAFNLDYYGALFRYYHDGHARWLNDVEKGATYTAGDAWGAVGTHYAGRWHTAAAEGYITTVKKHLTERTWEKRGF